MQNSPEHKILPNEKFGVKATSECKTPSNETTIKDDSHRKIQVLNFGGYYASLILIDNRLLDIHYLHSTSKNS